MVRKELIEDAGKEDAVKESKVQPPRIRLPRFIRDEDVGLGDLVTRVASSAGIRPCSGCHRRAVALNRWLVFTR
jgi:hypothetical protein